MMDAEGKYIPWTISDNYATGGYVVGGQPSNADTITVNGEVITFITSGTPAADEVLVGATTADTAQSIRDVINSDPELYGCTAAGSGTTVTLTAIAEGTAGNSVGTLEGVTSGSFTVAGATLTGADASADTPSNEAVAIAAQAAVAATPGTYFPVYVAGCFSHEALIWPAGIATLRPRKLAFAGTGIVVKQLL
jgi:phage tail sheath gpL-like